MKSLIDQRQALFSLTVLASFVLVACEDQNSSANARLLKLSNAIQTALQKHDPSTSQTIASLDEAFAPVERIPVDCSKSEAAGRIIRGEVICSGLTIADLRKRPWGSVLMRVVKLNGLEVPWFDSASNLDYASASKAGFVTKSITNARQIVTCCRIYSSDHDGRYPPSLDELIKEKIIDDFKLLHCPLLHDDSQTGYEYFGAGMKVTDDGAKILLISKAMMDGKRIIAFNDCRVVFAVPPADGIVLQK